MKPARHGERRRDSPERRAPFSTDPSQLMPYHVYLAGAITDCTIMQATEWRADATAVLSSPQVRVLDPLREQYESLCRYPSLPSLDPEHIEDGGGIVARDYFDIQRADVVLVNCDPARIHGHTSIGTAFELAWCYAARKPVVAFGGAGDRHPFINAAITHPARSREEAYRLVRLILGV